MASQEGPQQSRPAHAQEPAVLPYLSSVDFYLCTDGSCRQGDSAYQSALTHLGLDCQSRHETPEANEAPQATELRQASELPQANEVGNATLQANEVPQAREMQQRGFREKFQPALHQFLPGFDPRSVTLKPRTPRRTGAAMQNADLAPEPVACLTPILPSAPQTVSGPPEPSMLPLAPPAQRGSQPAATRDERGTVQIEGGLSASPSEDVPVSVAGVQAACRPLPSPAAFEPDSGHAQTRSSIAIYLYLMCTFSRARARALNEHGCKFAPPVQSLSPDGIRRFPAESAGFRHVGRLQRTSF